MDTERRTMARATLVLISLLLPACGSSSAGGDAASGGPDGVGVGGDAATGGAEGVGVGGDAASGDGVGAGGAAGAGAELGACELAEAIFAPDTLLEYRVTMDPALYEDLKANGNDEVYRPAALQVRGGDVAEDFEAVGVRYKGDYSLNHCWDDNGGVRSYSGECRKLSLKLKFNEIDPEARLFGLKRLNLNSMSYDDTKLRERLSYALFNDFGVNTARTTYARLVINDEPPLLMLAVEAIDGRYTACQYPEGGDGDLFKEVWPRPGMDEAALLEALRTNDDPDDNPDAGAFVEFGDAVGAATEDTFVDVMAGFIDREEVLRYMAVDRAIKNWDGFTAFYWAERSHNFYWYHDQGASERFDLIPWDLDQTLWDYDPYMDSTNRHAERQVPNWNVKPLSCEPITVWESGGEVTVIPSGCDPFINLLAATGWDEFAAIGAELLAGPLDFDAMDQQVTAWAAQIATAVDEDPTLNLQAWESEVEYLHGVLQKDVDDFRAHLEEGYAVEQ